MSGCSESKDMNRIVPIVLHEGDMTATLALPAAYRAKAFSSSGMQFVCRYPGMLPVVNWIEPSDMTVNILLGRTGKSHADQTFEMAQSDHFDPKRPGAPYRAGFKGEYQVFFKGDPANVQKGFSTYYLFKANDGQWVQVDWDEWSAIYTIERTMNSGISIKYWFMKSKGSDFIRIDEVVMEFIKAHFKTRIIHYKYKGAASHPNGESEN